jgi:hypothetical protein
LHAIDIAWQCPKIIFPSSVTVLNKAHKPGSIKPTWAHGACNLIYFSFGVLAVFNTPGGAGIIHVAG